MSWRRTVLKNGVLAAHLMPTIVDARTVTGAAGVRIYAESHTSHADASSSQTFVLIRGLGSQLIQWPASLVSGLVDRGYRVLVFDNRDSGLSQKCDDTEAAEGAGAAPASSDYTLDHMAADVIAVLDAFRVTAAHVFGISLGGAVCQRIATLFPSRTLTAFPVMTFAGQALQHISEEALQTQVFIDLPADAGKTEVVAATAASMRFGDCPGFPTPENVIKDLAARCFDRCFCPDGERRQGAAMSRGPSSDRRASNKTIVCPTLVIHGKDDRLINATGGQEVADSIPGAELLLVAGMGHSISEGLGDWMAGQVHDFVQRRVIRPDSSRL